MLQRARGGDERAFAQLTGPYRRELQVHCYRILGSLTDAEDLLQETLLAAWRGLPGFQERSSVRSWLYRIATNQCLNALRAAGRRVTPEPVPPFQPPEPTRRGEITWLQPYPDTLLEGIPDTAPVPTLANTQPALAGYLGDPARLAAVPAGLFVLTMAGEKIHALTRFHLDELYPRWGPVPEDPQDRADWQQRAAAIGAWRELSGDADPADPIGPEPVAAAPDLRVAWHQALAALGPADGPDVRGMPDGKLLHLRDTYSIETAWAPQYVGDELRQVRAVAGEARLAGLRAAAEATAARRRGDPGTAARQHELVTSYQALHQAYRQRETVFAATMADRAHWDAATRAQRHLAVAADAELRRRHAPPAPGRPLLLTPLLPRRLTAGQVIRRRRHRGIPAVARRRAPQARDPRMQLRDLSPQPPDLLIPDSARSAARGRRRQPGHKP